jgi:hypothetical protein
MIIDPHPDWLDQAACLHMSPTLFHAPAGSDAETEALQTCAACPACSECLDWAMATEATAARGSWPIHRAGIYGGTTPAQRAALYEQTAAA